MIDSYLLPARPLNMPPLMVSFNPYRQALDILVNGVIATSLDRPNRYLLTVEHEKRAELYVKLVYAGAPEDEVHKLISAILKSESWAPGNVPQPPVYPDPLTMQYVQGMVRDIMENKVTPDLPRFRFGRRLRALRRMTAILARELVEDVVEVILS